MRQGIKTIAALVLIGTLAGTGSAFAQDGWYVPPGYGRPYPPYAAYNAQLASEPFWAGGYVNGLTYNPYYCYQPGSCVFGYHQF